jgi:hypothetical protein
MNLDGAIRAVGRDDFLQNIGLLFLAPFLRRKRWFDVSYVRLNPYLKKVDGIVLGGVVLAVIDTLSSACELDSPSFDDLAVAHRVSMLKRTIKYNRKDLIIGMRVHSKAIATGDAVFVDDAQGPKSLEFGVIVASKPVD